MDENVRMNWMIACFRKYNGKEQGDSEYVHNNYTTITYTPEVSFLKVICHFQFVPKTLKQQYLITNNPGCISPEVVDGSYINAICVKASNA